MKGKWAKIIAFVVAGAVVVGLWVWYDMHNKPANPRIQEGVKRIVEKEPRVKPMYDSAMEDGMLTLSEARAIINEAQQLKDSR